MPTTSLTVDRVIVATVVVMTAMIFSAKALDPVNVPKLTVLLLGALALVATAVYRAVRYRVLFLPTGPPVLAATLLGVALVVSTVVSPATPTALYGAYGRNSGLLAYAGALLLFVVVLRVGNSGGVRTIAFGLGLSGLLVASYGMLQRLGIDSVPWNNPFNPIISALGNPDFAAAYMGICAPVAVGGALWPDWSPARRIAAGIIAELCVITALLSGAAQGPLAAGAGITVVAVVAALGLQLRARLVVLAALGVAAGSLATAVGIGAIFRAGPLSSLFTGISYDARTYYWGAALQMLQDRPLFGVGLDQYGGYWRTARSGQAVAQLGGTSFTDSAHSVPLQMLAQGGVFLGLAYLAFVVVTGVVLVLGLRRLTGNERLLLSMVGGSWLAYQVQSIVSIDQVPLIVLHFVTAGAVVAAAGAARLREVRLPGAPVPVVPPPKRSKGRTRGQPKERAVMERPARSLTTGDLLTLGLLGVLGLTVAWQALAPLRANIAAQEGDTLRNSSDRNTPLTAYRRATDILPGLPYAWVKQAEHLAGTTPPQPAGALKAYLAAAERDPRDPNTRRAAANQAETLGDLALSRALLRRAVELDPDNIETLTAAATFELRYDGAEAARALLEAAIPRFDAVARLPVQAPLWASLGDARAALGDLAGARVAYGVALFLQPDQAVATKGLAALPAG